MTNEFEKAEQLSRARLEKPSQIPEKSIEESKGLNKGTFLVLLILALIGDAGDFLSFTGIGVVISFLADIVIGVIMLLTVGLASPKNMGKNLAKIGGTIFADFIPFIDFLPFRTLGVIWIYRGK